MSVETCDEDSSVSQIERGTLWQNKKTGRVARVIRLVDTPWNIVEYHYTTSAETTGRGLIRGRTNTTSAGVDRFLKCFTKVSKPDCCCAGPNYHPDRACPVHPKRKR